MSREISNPAATQSDSTVTNDNTNVRTENTLGSTSLEDYRTATQAQSQTDDALPGAVIDEEAGFIEFSSGGEAATEADAGLEPAGGGDNLAPSSGRGIEIPEAGEAASPEDAGRQPHGGTIEGTSHGSGIVEGGEVAAPEDAGRQPRGGTTEGSSSGHGVRDDIGAGARSPVIGGDAKDLGAQTAKDAAKRAAKPNTILNVPPFGNSFLPPTSPRRQPNPNYRLEVN